MTKTEAMKKARRLIAKGKVEVSNDAAKKGGRSVAVQPLKNGILFEWSRPGIGFGGLTLVVRDGKLRTDREGMSVQFCLDVLRQALDEE